MGFYKSVKQLNLQANKKISVYIEANFEKTRLSNFCHKYFAIYIDNTTTQF